MLAATTTMVGPTQKCIVSDLPQSAMAGLGSGDASVENSEGHLQVVESFWPVTQRHLATYNKACVLKQFHGLSVQYKHASLIIDKKVFVK